MGKFANERAHREWQRQQDMKQDESFGEDEPLSEAERAADWDQEYWLRLDAHARGTGVGRWP